MDDNTWMQDPALANLPPEKLEFLNRLFLKSRSLTQKELLPFFLSLAARSQQDSIQFTGEEIRRVIAVLQTHSTPQEIRQIDGILRQWEARQTPERTQP